MGKRGGVAALLMIEEQFLNFSGQGNLVYFAGDALSDMSLPVEKDGCRDVFYSEALHLFRIYINEDGVIHLVPDHCCLDGGTAFCLVE